MNEEFFSQLSNIEQKVETSAETTRSIQQENANMKQMLRCIKYEVKKLKEDSNENIHKELHIIKYQIKKIKDHISTTDQEFLNEITRYKNIVKSLQREVSTIKESGTTPATTSTTKEYKNELHCLKYEVKKLKTQINSNFNSNSIFEPAFGLNPNLKTASSQDEQILKDIRIIKYQIKKIKDERLKAATLNFLSISFEMIYNSK